MYLRQVSRIKVVEGEIGVGWKRLCFIAKIFWVGSTTDLYFRLMTAS